MDTARGLELAALHGKPGDIYHLSGPERIDRYGFAQKLASIFNLPERLLKPCSMDAVPACAPRPRDVSLDCSRFMQYFNFTPRNITDGLHAVYAEYRETI